MHHFRPVDVPAQSWQVERAHARPLEGVGLGLSVSRELARRLGGELTVVSGLGEGATFLLELPLPPGSRPVAATPGNPPATSPIPPASDVYSAAPTSP